MAPVLTPREKLLRQARGLSFLQTGEMPRDGAFDIYNEQELRIFIGQYRLSINQNARMDVVAEQSDEPVSFAAQPAPVIPGVKDNLNNIITDVLDDGRYPENNGFAVKAVMSVAGYSVDIESSAFTEEERAALERFQNNLDSLSLEQIANSNFIVNTENERRAAAQAEAARRAEAEAQAAAEALAVSESELKASVSSMLVYGGYLAPEDADNDRRIASAMKTMMTIVTPHEDLVAEEAKIFENFTDWSLNEYALTYAQQHLGHIAPRSPDGVQDLLRTHLESNNPEQIKLAQGYLIAQGADIDVTGQIDPSTHEAALAELREPLPVPPEGLLADDGSVRLDNMLEMAVRGQLYLPIEKLSEADRRIAETLPLADDRQPGDISSRERFIAQRLILQDPEAYIQLLEEENARRATASLDVTVVQAQVHIDPAATVMEEREELNNPLGLDAAQPGQLGGELLTGAPLHNAADGVSDRFGELQFSSTETGLISFVNFMKDSAPTGQVTMIDAMRGLHYASMTEQEAFIGGATGSLDAPLQQHADRIVQMLGLDPEHRFDLNNSAEVEKLLTGLVGYTNRAELGRDFITATQSHETWGPSIRRAAQGSVPAETTPEAPEDIAPSDTMEISSLRDNFRLQASGVTVGTPGVEPVPVADNNNRRLAAVAGYDGPSGMA